MSTATLPPMPSTLPLSGLPVHAPNIMRFTTAEYDRWTDLGLFEGKRVELLNGYLLKKMPHDPSHDNTLDILNEILGTLELKGWRKRVQMVLALDKSRPEPDLVIARGDRSTYVSRHPNPADLGIVIEVSNTTLTTDRTDKLEIYARNGVPEYWIVNLLEQCIEVYRQPAGDAYLQQSVFKVNDVLQFVIDGVEYQIEVSSVFCHLSDGI